MAASGDNPFGKSTEIPEPEPDDSPPVNAWQPFTPSGVGAFARANKSRLFIAALVTALFPVATLIWFLQVAWFPVVINAIRALPDEGVIETGELITPQIAPDPLAQNNFLAIAVDIRHLSGPDASPDVYLKFNQRDVQICSFIGCLTLRYPIHRSFYFNRLDLESRWGAWMPFILGSLTAAVTLGLILSWATLAMIYAPIVRLLGYFRDKNVSLVASWKLASAAMLPGGFFCGIAVLLYGLELISLVSFSVLFVLHFFIPWVYLFLAPKTLPSLAEVLPGNPFK